MIEGNILSGVDNEEEVNLLIKKINNEITDNNNEELIVFNRSALYVIVEENKVPVGLGALVKKNDMYYIEFVYVLMSKRRNYYGDLIVKMLIDKGFKLNAKEIYINSDNSYNQFYTKIGFSQINKSEMVITEDRLHKCCH